MVVNTGEFHFFNVLSVNILSDTRVLIVYLNDANLITYEVVKLDPDHLDIVFTRDPQE